MHSIMIDFPGQGIYALWFARIPPTDQNQCYVFRDFISTCFLLYSSGYKSRKCQSYTGLILKKGVLLFFFLGAPGSRTKALLLL